MSALDLSDRWRVLGADPAVERALADGLSVPPLVARIMAARGIKTIDEGRLFLTPSLERDWCDPLIIPGMEAVAARVERAVRDDESIVVFGDFDVDGITSTCLMTEALAALGARVHPFIPRRFDEGYGITEAALERMVAEASPSVVVTVDNGIAARNEVAYLASRGIDLVVTDHHEPADLVPQGVPLADPKLADEGPSRELAGVGVALKLVQVLGARLGQPDLWRRYLEVAALGTVSDMMTLTPENRALVAAGVEQMRRTARPGYVALAALCRTDLASVTADGLSFSLIPRINAAGRMADPMLALNLLMAKDPVEAARLAAELEQTNARRRDIEAELTDEAVAEAERTYTGGRVVVVAGEGWHEGVKGIVASRLVNRYHVPALLFSVEDGVARGSGRSVGSVNLFEAVEQCADLLIRFGGHAGAVGVTCSVENLPAFRERLEEALSRLPREDFQDTGEVAAICSLDELDVETVSALSRLEPFGQGNKVPLIGIKNVLMCDRATVGRTGDHMRFVASDGMVSVPAIMFRVPDVEDMVSCDEVVDLVCEAVAETWQGRTKTKLMVKDVLRGQRLSPEEDDRPLAAASAPAPCGPAPADLARKRERLAALPYDELTRTIVHAFIGANVPHAAQLRALDNLGAGKNVMAVMGTGRGKSMIFHVHAAREAIAHGAASVFVYPLRALVADQAFHLRARMEQLGVGVGVLTGDTDMGERERLFSGISRGRVDIVLTTPEFFVLHADEFARSGRVRFVVVDECHHVADAPSGSRSAYLSFPYVLERLGSPRVLALTATAGASTYECVRDVLGIDSLVVDDTIRPNLAIEDDRDLSSRDRRLVSIVAEGTKCVVYVNSREQSVALARMLRHRIPGLGAAIAYYNAGLSHDERVQVEDAFRRGDVSCIVSTSAFGEGVNLPDIRHVVLYHMPFCATEFNQMSGRAGRDGEPARIHLLYSSRDARINERLLDSLAPARDDLVALYRALMTLSRTAARQTGGASFELDAPYVAQLARSIDARACVDERSVPAALGVFEELGFASVSGADERVRVEMAQHPGKVELGRSIRYLEGVRARMEFDRFKDWALKAPARDMLARVNRPITPQA